MQRAIRILAIILVLQVMLTVFLHWSPQRASSAQVPPHLLNLKNGNPDEILLQGPAHKIVKIGKTKSGWILPGYFNLPADTQKIQQVLNRLLKIVPGWPVAVTKDSAKRFEVDEQHFQRRLEFRQSGKTVATLLLGTSPGLRKVHARIPGDKRIYAIDFGTSEIPIKQVSWLDKMLLGVKQVPDRIALKDVVLRRQKDIWLLDKTGINETLDQEKVGHFLRQLRDLTVIEVVDEKSLGNIQNGVVLKLQQGDSKQELTFYKSGDQYLVHSSRYPVYFRIFSAMGKAIMQVDRKVLTGKPVEKKGVEQKTQK